MSNEANNVTFQNRGIGGRGEGVDGDYEIPQILPSVKMPAARGRGRGGRRRGGRGGGGRGEQGARGDGYEVPNIHSHSSCQPPTVTTSAAESVYEPL